MPKNRIHRASDGRYTYSIVDSAGKRRRLISRKGENKTAFIARCNALDHEIAITSGQTKMTFGELFELYKNNHLCETSLGNKKNMIDVYQKHIEPEFAHLTLEKLSTKVIYKFLQNKIKDGFSKSYISKMRVCLSAPFSWAITSGITGVINPTKDIKLTYRKNNKKDNPNSAIPETDLQRFFKAAKKTKYYAYFVLLLETGLRPSECLGLKWSDYDGKQIHVQRAITRYEHSRGKTYNANRFVPASDAVKSALEEYSNTSIWIFPTAVGSPNMDSVITSFKRIKNKTQEYDENKNLLHPPVNFTLYSFRHTFATNCVRSGMLPSTLQYIMGHESIEITLKYYVDIQKQDLDLAADKITSFSIFNNFSEK